MQYTLSVYRMYRMPSSSLVHACDIMNIILYVVVNHYIVIIFIIHFTCHYFVFNIIHTSRLINNSIYKA